MSIWHYTDREGRRAAEAFSAVQVMEDQQVLGEFASIEQAVASGEAAPRIAHDAPMVAKIARLPPERAKHWLAELARVGARVEQAPAPQPPKGKQQKSEGI